MSCVFFFHCFFFPIISFQRICYVGRGDEEEEKGRDLGEDKDGCYFVCVCVLNGNILIIISSSLLFF